MAKKSKMTRGVTGQPQHDEGRKVDYPSFVHTVDQHGNVFCSLPDMDRIYPRYHTVEELEDAWRWRDTDLVTEEGLRKLAGV